MATFDELTGAVAYQQPISEVQLAPETVLWTVNGGYIAAIALKLAGQLSSFSRPGSIDVHFLKSLAAGSAQATTSSAFTSRTAELIVVQLFQGDKLCVIAHVWCLAEAEGPLHIDARMPLVPRPSELRPIAEVLEDGEPEVHKFWDPFEQRPIARTSSRQHNYSRLFRWFRYNGENNFAEAYNAAARGLPLIDLLGVVAASQHYDKPLLTSLAPTIRLSTQFYDTDYRGEWLLVDAKCEFIAKGLVTSKVRLWGENGELVADGLSQMVLKPGRGAYVGEA